MIKRIVTIALLVITNILLFGCEELNINLPTTTSTTTNNDDSTTTSTSNEDTNTTTTTIQTTTTEISTTTTTTENTITLNTVDEVKNGTVGETYTVQATVVGTTKQGALIHDGMEFIYVYLGTEPTISVDDFVEVTGETSSYGGAVQFGSSSTITKISTSTSNYSFIPIEKSASELSSYINDYTVGEYIQLTGTLSIDGNYINLNMPDTTVVGSLNTNNTSLDLTQLNGKTTTVEGFMLYVSGSSTKYLNILVTNAYEDTGDELDTIVEVKNGIVGETYTVQATVVGTTKQGALIHDGMEFIYVYLGTEPTISVDDFVEVTGETSSYGGAVQFGSSSTITKISSSTSNYTFIPIEKSESELSSYINDYTVGEYIQLTGTLSINGTYINLNMPDTTVVGSLNTNDTSLDLTQLNGKTITVEGFMLYVSGSKYLNILVTNAYEETVNNDTFPLTILTVNDLHGYIEQDEYGMGGLSNMAYLVNQIRNENNLDDVILIGNGDMLQGTSISNMTNGLAVIDAMSMMGFDAMGVGNHEFDWEIDTILDYFDGNVSNGEAGFPLLNANIYSIADDSLLTVSNGNVFNSTVINKEGIDVGIISYVGDVYGSISYDKVDEYYFDLDISNSVLDIGNDLKRAGTDVIIVNIHGYDYATHSDLSVLRDDNGDYLVDAVITGHTHSYREESFPRYGGVDMPVIQAGSYNRDFGKITLNINLDTMEVSNYALDIIDVSTAGTNFDPTVETIIDQYSESLGDEVLVTSGETIYSTSQLFDWVGNVMVAATGADIAIHNNGGVRSTGGITAGNPVTLSQMYEVSPFDNTLWLVEGTYAELQGLLGNSSLFYSLAPGVELNDQQTYTVAIISYVYYNYDQVDHLRTLEDIDTGLYIRDILVEDLRLKDLAGDTFSPSNHPEASIGLLYQ